MHAAESSGVSARACSKLRYVDRFAGGAVVLGDELHDLARLVHLGGEDAPLEQTAAENGEPDLGDLAESANGSGAGTSGPARSRR